MMMKAKVMMEPKMTKRMAAVPRMVQQLTQSLLAFRRNDATLASEFAITSLPETPRNVGVRVRRTRHVHLPIQETGGLALVPGTTKSRATR